MKLNLQNVEELIFYDKKVNAMFPEFRSLFDQWKLGQTFAGLKTLAQRSCLDLLNSLNEEQIKKLEEYFQDSIIVDVLNYNLTDHFESSIYDAEGLCKFSGYKEFSVYRNKDQMYISFWR